jgi:hypothetical protein
LSALRDAVSELGAPEVSFGEWQGGDLLPDGGYPMPCFEYSPLADRYTRAAGESGFPIPDLDWRTWPWTREAIGRIPFASRLSVEPAR